MNIGDIFDWNPSNGVEVNILVVDTLGDDVIGNIYRGMDWDIVHLIRDPCVCCLRDLVEVCGVSLVMFGR